MVKKPYPVSDRMSHIPHCNKKNDYCNYEDHRECEMYEEGI